MSRFEQQLRHLCLEFAPPKFTLSHDYEEHIATKQCSYATLNHAPGPLHYFDVTGFFHPTSVNATIGEHIDAIRAGMKVALQLCTTGRLREILLFVQEGPFVTFPRAIQEFLSKRNPTNTLKHAHHSFVVAMWMCFVL